MLSNPRDIAPNASITFPSMDIDDNFIYIATSSSILIKFAASSLEQVGGTISSVVGVSSGLAMITPASAVIVSSSNTQVDFIDVTTGNRRQITTGAAGATYAQPGSQLAVNKSLGVGLATRNTDNTILKIQSNQTLSSLTPATLTGSGVRASSIILKQATGADPQKWLVGTTNGKIHEMDSSGTTSKTITLPLVPAIGAAPTNMSVVAMAHYPPNLICATSYGTYYIYEYESGSLIYQSPAGSVANSVIPSVGLICSNAASGLTYFAHNGAFVDAPIDEVYFSTPSPIFDSFSNSDAQSSVGVFKMQIYGTRLYATYNTSGFSRLRVWDINGGALNRMMEPVELHDPPGVRIPGRVIRIRIGDAGRSCVEADQFIGATPTDIPAFDGVSYIDVAINGDNTKWDIREFTK